MLAANFAPGSCTPRSWRGPTSVCSTSQLTICHSLISPAPPRAWGRWKHTTADPVREHRPAGQARRLVVVAARDPYEVLGVPRSASADEIKRAYRKKALKLHPDVNKALDAKDRFMECKNAYQQLLDQKQAGRGAARGQTCTADPWGSRGRATYGAGSSSSTSSRGRQRAAPPPEESYGFGDLVDYAFSLGQSARRKFNSAVSTAEDFIRDLEKEFTEYSKERAAASPSSSSSGGSRMKSLWEELADIGEGIAGEFVEFLEQELGLSDDDAGSKSAGRATTSSTEQRSSSSSSTTTSSKAQASSESKAVSSSSQGYREASQQKASRAQDVEDELQALKRKLGIK